MSAIAEVAGLLRPGEPLDAEAGYLDLLGEEDAVGPHRTQQLFRSRAFLKVYERIWRPLTARVFLGLLGPGAAAEQRIALEMIDVRRGERVLDVGCGPGNYTRPLAEAAGDGLTVGLDASEAMVAEATKRGGGENLVYLRGDACALPFADESFDVAASVGVIHMVPKPLTALGEMVRVLAPGGRLLAVVTCGRKGRPRRERAGLTVFAHEEISDALQGHGLIDIERRVIRRGQFVTARKPSGEVQHGR